MVLLCLALPGVLNAQGGYTSITYLMGFGTGDLGDYVSKASFRGASFEYQKRINDNVSAGIELAWSTFYERMDYGTYNHENISLSGIQYRYSNNFPMLVTAEYNISPDALLQPFVNFGLGTMYTERTTQMGTWMVQDKVWHFAIKPEAGIFYEVSYNTTLELSAKYYMGFAAENLETQAYIGLSVGIVFTF